MQKICKKVFCCGSLRQKVCIFTWMAKLPHQSYTLGASDSLSSHVSCSLLGLHMPTITAISFFNWIITVPPESCPTPWTRGLCSASQAASQRRKEHKIQELQVPGACTDKHRYRQTDCQIKYFSVAYQTKANLLRSGVLTTLFLNQVCRNEMVWHLSIKDFSIFHLMQNCVISTPPSYLIWNQSLKHSQIQKSTFRFLIKVQCWNMA